MTQNNSAFWIGLSDEDELNSIRREGVFQWSSGEHLSSYVNWKFGEPTNKQHLDCVKADNSGWSMARGGCASSKLPFVCKKRGKLQNNNYVYKCIQILLHVRHCTAQILTHAYAHVHEPAHSLTWS